MQNLRFRRWEQPTLQPSYRGVAPELPSGLGWYKASSIEIPIHVEDVVEDEEDFYRNNVKPKPKCEDWRLLMRSLRERTNYLCCNEMLSDFVITLKFEEDKHIPAHRFLLALRSPVFRTRFYGSFSKESIDNENHCCIDASESTVKSVLKYIHADAVPPSTVDLLELLDIMQLAKYFLIIDLVSICEQQLIKMLNISNACQLFEAAYIFDLDNLMEACLKHYDEEFDVFLSSPYFLTLNSAIVKSLYDRAKVFDRTQDFAHYLMRWGESELQRRGMPPFELAALLVPFFKLHMERTSQTKKK